MFREREVQARDSEGDQGFCQPWDQVVYRDDLCMRVILA